MTLLLNANIEPDFAQAIHLLQAGALVAVPTETVYGLAADARQPDAVRAIFLAKNRPANHPLIIHIAHVAQLDDWAINIPPTAYLLANHFWPGPLTLVLQKSPAVDPIVTGGHDTVAIRIPAHPALLTLLTRSGLALAAPSANPHKRLSPTSANHVLSTMAGKIAAVLDGGECTLGIESTILDLTESTPRVLRPGPITATELTTCLGLPVLCPYQHHIEVPGNMPEHYRPCTPVHLKTGQAVRESTEYPVVRLLLGSSTDNPRPHDSLEMTMPREKSRYGQMLYRALHQADQMHAREIWIELPPTTEQWSDIYDRLIRASVGS
jgi:L-threonylcarbamoyladenylate synthase